jgi:HEAT repeat protein
MVTDHFNTMATENPVLLAAILRYLSTSPLATLSFAAEAAGNIEEFSSVRDILLNLLKHKSALVREGAIYGLARHIDEEMFDTIRNIGFNDPSPGVREAALEAID